MDSVAGGITKLVEAVNISGDISPMMCLDVSPVAGVEEGGFWIAAI